MRSRPDLLSTLCSVAVSSGLGPTPHSHPCRVPLRDLGLGRPPVPASGCQHPPFILLLSTVGLGNRGAVSCPAAEVWECRHQYHGASCLGLVPAASH